jgi:hypothetical protein
MANKYREDPEVKACLLPYIKATFGRGFVHFKSVEQAAIKQFMLSEALLIVRGERESIYYYPHVFGIDPKTVEQTIISLAAIFEQRTRERQVAQRLKAQALSLVVSNKVSRKLKATEVTLELNAPLYDQALALMLHDCGVTERGLERMRVFALAINKLCELLTLEENKVSLKIISGHATHAYFERTVADMVKEMEGELVAGLEPYMAYCRILSPKAREGERLKTHKIRILAPLEGIEGEALEERIKSIREQSLNLYYTPCHQVEEQIKARFEYWQKRPLPIIDKPLGRTNRRTGQGTGEDTTPQHSLPGAEEDAKEQSPEPPPQWSR